MKTKKRFFLKAAGISLAKWAGISLALVMMFAMAFAACDTGTSSSKTTLPDDDSGGGGGGGGGNTVVPVETPYRDSSGYYVLTITESGGAVTSYRLVYGNTVSSGTVTVVGSYWAFTSYTGETFTMYVGGTGANRTFVPTPPTTIRADDGTSTITIPSFGTVSSGDGGNTGSPGPIYTVGNETSLRTALAANPKGVFRITSNELTLTKASGDLVVHAGQHIVVGGTGNSVGQYSAGGPLFAITNASNILNIGTRLRLESGASLTIARDAAVNVTYGGVLHAASDANGGAKVGVGVNVSGGNQVDIGTSGVSSLYIAAGGALHIEGDSEKSGLSATLAVNNTTAASKVYLESATSALTLEKNAILLVEGGSNPLTDAAVDDKGVPIPVGTAEADRIIGTTSASVIEIPATASAAAIGAVTVKGYEGSSVSSGIASAFTKAADKATENSTAATTAEATGATGVQALLNSKTRVTYSGDTALSTAITALGKTLIITGTVSTESAFAINVGTLEIADGASLSLTTAGTINAGTLTNNGTIEVTNTTAAANFATLVGIPNTGTGKVLLLAAISSDVTAPLTLGTDLEIGAGGKIPLTAATSPTAAFSGSGKTVAILEENTTNGALVLGSNISEYGTGVTVTNNGKHATAAITTATTKVEVLNALLAAKGNITASGEVAVGEDGDPDDSAVLTVPDNTALTITDLAVNHADSVLTVSVGTTASTLAITNAIGTNQGTIKTANAAVLETLLGKVEAGIVEVTDNVTLAGSLTPTLGANVTLKIADEKVLTIPSTTTLTVSGTIDANGGTTGSITNDGTIKTGAATKSALDPILAIGGKIEASGQVSVADNETLNIENGVTLTIANSAKLTVAAINGKVTVKSGGTLVSANGSTGELNGELEVESGGTYKDLNTHGATLWLNGTGTPAGTGTMTWNAGAKGYIGGEAATDLRIGGAGDAATLKLAAGGVLKNTKSGYELTGNATVGRYGLSNGLTFKLNENSTFTVDVPASFASERGIVITDVGCKIEGTAGDNPSKIIILPDNFIFVWYADAKNFYNSSSEKIDLGVDQTNAGTSIPAGTYVWDENADGSGADGWKEQE